MNSALNIYSLSLNKTISTYPLQNFSLTIPLNPAAIAATLSSKAKATGVVCSASQERV